MNKHRITCPACGRDYRSAIDEDTGYAKDRCTTCGYSTPDYWDEAEDEK
jgi:transcription elongation factor Elf1